MQEKVIRKRKLSVFTYFAIFVFIAGLTVLTIKELDITSGLEEILYQKDVISNIEQENKYYINKIKKEYGITIGYGEEEKSFLSSVNANVQEDLNIVNNNIKIIYNALKKYPSDVFDIFKEEKYSLYILLVSNFNDNNIALASKNTLNQYRVFLSNNENFERSLHHELFHVLEYYMLDKVKFLYYAWNSYNPINFKYEQNIEKLTDEHVYNKYLTEDKNSNSYFLTKYSKVSAKEDRAEIFAELMIATKKLPYLEEGQNIKKKANKIDESILENVTTSKFPYYNILK